jgi:hypothetical protein
MTSELANCRPLGKSKEGTLTQDTWTHMSESRVTAMFLRNIETEMSK